MYGIFGIEIHFEAVRLALFHNELFTKTFRLVSFAAFQRAFFSFSNNMGPPLK